MRSDRILLAHGSGGTMMKELIEEVFVAGFGDEVLLRMDDAAALDFPGSRLAFSTDTYVVHPLFFPGGDIGKLAVCGTVNDVATSGARPLYLSVGFVLEEGMPVEDLRRILVSMHDAAAEAGVRIVTGDTKVVERGHGDGCVNLKESDFVEQLFISSTHDYVLFFSTKGKVYRLKVHEIPMGSRHARGTAVVNLLPFEQDERIAAVITTREFSADEYLLFATSHGMVKKTAIQAYDRSRRDGIIAINLRNGDELIAVRRVKQGERVMMVSAEGKAITWDESDARPMGRDTTVVRGMNVKDDDRVLGMEIVYPGSELFVVTERGYGKRTPVDQYPIQNRGGMGVKTIQVTEKKGRLAGMKIVMPGHELMLISEEGVVIRVKAEDISQLGRSTQGVKVMNVGDADRVSAIARVSAKKRKRPAAVEGQQALIEEPEDRVPGMTDREAEAEELVSEDFDEDE